MILLCRGLKKTWLGVSTEKVCGAVRGTWGIRPCTVMVAGRTNREIDHDSGGGGYMLFLAVIMEDGNRGNRLSGKAR